MFNKPYLPFLSALLLLIVSASSDAFLLAPNLKHLRTLPKATQPAPTRTALFAKKKNAAAKKIQVKMLKNVPGTGQKGDVVQVTPAFFNNKLRPTQSAQVISDEEVQEEQSEKAAAMEAEQEEANEVKEILEENQLTMQRKAGPDGHLFGGIGAKAIMEEVQKQVPGHEGFLTRGKVVKVISVQDGNGKKLRQDIKETGEFGAKIALTRDISATIKIAVKAE